MVELSEDAKTQIIACGVAYFNDLVANANDSQLAASAEEVTKLATDEEFKT